MTYKQIFERGLSSKLLSLLLPLLLLCIHSTSAVTYTTCDLNTLQSAILIGGAITFSCTTASTISVTSTLIINQTVSIDGGQLLTISGAPSVNLFTVQGSGPYNVSFTGLTLVNYAGVLSIGAASSNTIAVKITNSNLIGGAAFPYAIQVTGGKAAITIDKSFISSSNFTASGSFISALSSATMNVVVTSSTLSGTSSAPQGFSWAGASQGSLVLVRCTAAYFTGDIISVSADSTVKANFTSNILGSGINGTLGDTATLPSTGVNSGGYNVIWKNILPAGVAQPSDQVGISPLISSTPSSLNGAFTQVYTLQACSPAINDGSPDTSIIVDQINAARVVQSYSDSGAYESNLVPCIYVTNPNVTLNSSKNAVISFNVTFKVSSLFAESPLQINYATSDGTAVVGVDYNQLISNVQWTAGRATAAVPITFQIQPTLEYKPTLVFYISLTVPGSINAIVTTPQVIVTIKNTSPLPTLTLSRNPIDLPNFNEGGTANFKLSSDILSSIVSSTSLTYTGSAVAGVNYITTYNVSIAPGKNSVAFTVVTSYNPVCEGPKNLTITLSSPVNSQLGTGAAIVQSFTIYDIDTCYVSFQTNSASVNEASGLLVLNYIYNLPTSSPSSFNFTVSGPTNLYSIANPMSSSVINVLPYQTTGNITMNITQDFIYKPTPVQLSVVLSAFSGILGNITQEDVTVTNVDPEPTVSIVSSVTNTNETTSSFPFSLMLSGLTDQVVTLSLVYSGKSLAINNVANPSALPQTVVFSPLQTTINLTVPLQQNFMCGDGNLSVAINTTSVQNANLGTSLSVTADILDVDQCFLTLQTNSLAVNEGVGLIQLPFVLNLPLVDPSSFVYNVSASTVNLYAGGDNTGFAMSSIQIPNRTASGSISLNITRDYVHQQVSPSTILVTLGGFNNLLRAGAITQETVNVTDVDPNPTLSLQISATDVNENTATPIVLTLTLSGKRSNALNVSLTYVGNYNYTNNLQDPISVPSQITFAPLQTVVTISLTLQQNNLCGDQKLTVAIDQSSLPTVDIVNVGSSTVSLTIRNVDECAVSFEYANVTVNEASGSLSLPWFLSYPSMQTSFFSVDITGSNLLYQYTARSTINLDAYQSSGNITLSIIRDNIHQLTPISQLTVTLDSFSGTLAAGNITSEIIYVIDVDPVPSVSLALSAYAVAENSGSPITVTVTLSGQTAAYVNLSLVYGGDSNVNNNILSATQSITFQPLQTTATGLIYVKHNFICGSQNLTMKIDNSSLTSAVLSSSNAIDAALNILDIDQCRVSFVSSQETVDEGSGPIILSFIVSLPSQQTTYFSFNLTSPPNLLGLVENTNTTIELAPLQTSGNITVNVSRDYVHQAVNPTLTYVSIYGFSDTISGGPNTRETIYVTDEDPAVVASLAAPASSSSQITETSATPITITVSLNTITALPVNVSLAYSGGGVNNLNNAPSQIIFAPFQQQQTVSIYLQQNNVCGNQSLTISLDSSVFNGALINATSSSTKVLVIDVSVCTATLQCGQIATNFTANGIFVTVPISVDQPSSMVTNTAFQTNQSSAGGDALQITQVTSSPIVFPAYSVNSSVVLQVGNQQTYEPTRNIAILLATSQNSLAIATQAPCIVQIPSIVPKPSLYFSVSASVRNLTISASANQKTTFTLAVGLTSPSYQDISFTVVFSGTAKIGVDYIISSSSRKKSPLDTAYTNDNTTTNNSSTSYTYSIRASQSSVQFQLAILNTTSTNASVLYATIGNPSNAVLSPALSTLTVQIGGVIPPLLPTPTPTTRAGFIVVVQTSSGLSKGALAGIIIGAFFLLLLIILLIVLIVRRGQKRNTTIEMTMVTAD